MRNEMKRHHVPTSIGCLCVALVAALTGCAVGPAYQTPPVATPAAYREVPGWERAVPAEVALDQTWWTLFGDANLNDLMAQLAISNQNVAAAAAAYAQARATVAGQRAAQFPLVTVDGGARRAGGGGGSGANAVGSTGASTGNSSGNGGTTYQASIGASWEPDVWGRLGRGVDAANAAAQASSADLAAALLSARGELALDYLSLRQSDAQRALLQQTIAGYQRALEITQHRYDAGIAPRTDLLQAQTQLANAQIDEVGLARQRAQFEHAIAVLIGRPAADFTVAPVSAWQPVVPLIPAGVPSTLLQRRPDIAAAERRVAVANQQIGIAQAGFYPSLTLSASDGVSARSVADLFAASTSVWSLGLSAAQVLFDAGATRARVSAAQAAQDQAAARYRQTVLGAFAAVEDQLAALRVLAQQQVLRRVASTAADQSEAQALNRYRAGQIGYAEVVSAQAAALAARRALVQSAADQQSSTVALIQALGGGWTP